MSRIQDAFSSPQNLINAAKGAGGVLLVATSIILAFRTTLPAGVNSLTPYILYADLAYIGTLILGACAYSLFRKRDTFSLLFTNDKYPKLPEVVALKGEGMCESSIGTLPGTQGMVRGQLKRHDGTLLDALFFRVKYTGDTDDHLAHYKFMFENPGHPKASGIYQAINKHDLSRVVTCCFVKEEGKIKQIPFYDNIIDAKISAVSPYPYLYGPWVSANVGRDEIPEETFSKFVDKLFYSTSAQDCSKRGHWVLA